MGAFIDLTGQKFGKLIVIERAENTKDGRACWLCKCKCGEFVTAIGKDLRRGHTKSCGCLQREKAIQTGKMRKTHGKTKTKLFDVWHSMKQRCYYCKSSEYHNYGGRGITVCDEWLHDFQAFYEWAMANGYADNLTIDRIDVDGNYEPSNCRWVTMKEQQNNKRNNHLLTYKGETHTLSEWARIKHINKNTLRGRIVFYGWNIEKALNTPSNHIKKN